MTLTHAFILCFIGHCTCGAELEILITDLPSTEFLLFSCYITDVGSEGVPCGKVQLRGSKRRKVVAAANANGVIQTRGRRAGKLMRPGDKEPSIVASSSVIRTAQSQDKASKRPIKEKRPIIAVEHLQSGCCKDMIQHISTVPVSVHYSTPLQTQIYNDAAQQGYVKITIDSTGRVVDKVIHLDGEYSGPIFLYVIVVNVDGKLVRVSQMLTESHKTVDVQNWLTRWVSNVPTPREAVSDGSLALLNAMARTFASFPSIERYSNYLFNCKKEDLPYCRIRSDGAHKMKNWCKTVNSAISLEPVRVFYKAVMGALITATSKDAAGSILDDFFVVCLSEYDGQLPDGSDSLCEAAIKRLKQLITSKYS